MRRSLALLLSSGCFAGLAQSQPSPEHRWILPELHAPRVERVLFHSPSVETEVSFYLYKPEAYDTDAERRFPVLYWLHGGGGGGAGVPPLANRFGRYG